MKIKIIREKYNATNTIGRLYINDEFFCFTLEDVVRDKNRDGDLADGGEAKVYGKTAILSGIYEVIVNWSNNFKKYLPLLLKVKHFEGIRFHGGNTEADSLGCILCGKATDWQKIWNCKNAVDYITKEIAKASKNEKVFVEIIDQQ